MALPETAAVVQVGDDSGLVGSSTSCHTAATTLSYPQLPVQWFVQKEEDRGYFLFIAVSAQPLAGVWHTQALGGTCGAWNWQCGRGAGCPSGILVRSLHY